MNAALPRVAAFALLWWVLAEGRHDGWLLGALAVGAASATSLRLHPPGAHAIHLAALPGFLWFFLRHSIRGGVQVAALALRGRAALRPVMIDVSLALPSEGARILLAGTLGLTPGTLSVTCTDARLRLHILDERLPVLAEIQAAQAAVARLYGAPA